MEHLAMYITLGVSLFLLIGLCFLSFFTVQQGKVTVITRFGKFLKISPTGINFKIPFVDSIMSTISLQNCSTSLKFQAITIDQANVNFNVMLLFSALDSSDETIKNLAFKFRTSEDFNSALMRTTEGAVRGYISGKKQSEVLLIRTDIVDHVKAELDSKLASWGYHLHDLQVNDISFDSAIMASMAQVVASSNLKAAAENEGQALLIKLTKKAEAEGTAIKIQAESESTAAQLRGQGVAKFREEVAKGMAEAAGEMKRANLDTNLITFSMWTEAIKNFAEHGKGNVIFLDGSVTGMEQTLKQLQGLMLAKPLASEPIAQINS